MHNLPLAVPIVLYIDDMANSPNDKSRFFVRQNIRTYRTQEKIVWRPLDFGESETLKRLSNKYIHEYKR